MPGKPQLISQVLMDTLDRVTSPKSSQMLQTGVGLIVLDAIDRKVNRSYMGELLEESMRLYASLGRLRLAAVMKTALKDGKLDAGTLDKTVTDITAECERMRTSIMKKLELQAQTPVEDLDTIH